MTHRIGRVVPASPAVVVGPGHGAEVAPGRWRVVFAPPAAAGGTKFLMLHFTAASWGAGDRIEIGLGYGTDRFAAADGTNFWSRPVAGNSVAIEFVDGGSGAGQATLGEFGRGEGIQLNGQDAAAGGNGNGDLFMIDGGWTDPGYYNQYGVCPAGSAPSWENVERLPAGVMRDTARSVGMLVDAHGSDVSTCSATLIGPDLILTAGHCADSLAGVASTSFTLDFATDALGNRPAGYSPRFHKVKRLVKTGFAVPGVGAGVSSGSGLDYAVLQLDTPPGGLGVPPRSLRSTELVLGEELFIIHHPRGTAKKVSRKPADPTCQVITVVGNRLTYACDSDNGSSGSSVFDMSGQIVAVNDWAPGSCSNEGQAARAILADLSKPMPAFQDVDVMLVLDRSGSMAAPGFRGDRTKIEEARAAAALFIDLLRTDRTHRAGLASFSTGTSLDFGLAPVSDANKDTLIGPAPARNAGIVGGIAPGGSTTIGGGLRRGHDALPAPGASANLPALLLLTDGLENTAPRIADVEAELGATRLCIVGFGSEGSVDGPRLTTLARSHGGIYTRAGEGLQLKKFFVLCFGNIFQTAVSMDPLMVMPAGATRVAPIPLAVCGEESLTVVLSWENAGEQLQLSLLTPAGSPITAATPGITVSSGGTWVYFRLALPFGGERDGGWQVLVARSGGGGEFPLPLNEERFFVTATVEGGPYFRPLEPRRYYTGDIINPQVILREPSGFLVDAEVMLDVELPLEGTGNILAASGLRPAGERDGDVIDARTSTLIALEQERGPLIPTSSRTLELYDDGERDGDFALEPDGIYGNPLADLSRFEGHYTFHARATYGEACTGTREATWTAYVAVGIDPGATVVSAQTLASLPDGRERVRLTFTPRDRYGNYLGPGRLDGFEVQPQPGSTPLGPAHDRGDGSYEVEVAYDPLAESPPQVGLAQPERPAVVVGPAEARRFVYSVKFVCGEQRAEGCECAPVRPGRYATEINIHNPHSRDVPIVQRVLPLVLAGAARGRAPGFARPLAAERIVLPAGGASMDDCCRVVELMLGARPPAPGPLSLGLIEIVSPVELDITAVYTASGPGGGAPSIDVVTIAGRRSA